MTPIAVTGMGAVSAQGADLDAIWSASAAGVSGIARYEVGCGEHDPAPFTVPLGRVGHGFAAVLDDRLGRPVAAALDPFARFALGPAAEAIAQAGLVGDPVLSERTAVVLGHGFGGLDTLEAGYARYFGARSPRIHPASVPKTMSSAAASAVSQSYGIHGPVFSTSSACASSAHAIAQGAGLISTGLADVAIVGGSEAITTPGSLRAWEAIHAMSATACRPFSVGRDGMVLGEGGAVLVLENLEHARSRGAPVLAVLSGVGMSSDAFDITKPSADGQARAMTQATRCAAELAREPADVLVSAHGTGTPLNDATETDMLVAVFGEAARGMPVIATKSAHGHLIGGTAALQAVIGLRALAAQQAPPVLNFLERDPACDLDLVLEAARPIRARTLIQNAFAFGGLNVVLVFRREA